MAKRSKKRPNVPATTRTKTVPDIPSAGRSKKLPHVPPPERGWDTSYPSWSLSDIDFDGPFAWSKLQGSERDHVVRRLGQLETQTWAQLKGPDHHEIEVGALSKTARDRLVEIHADDLDRLMSLRVTGRQRVFCIRREHCGHILWWDPEHAVYPVTKRHT